MQSLRTFRGFHNLLFFPNPRKTLIGLILNTKTLKKSAQKVIRLFVVSLALFFSISPRHIQTFKSGLYKKNYKEEMSGRTLPRVGMSNNETQYYTAGHLRVLKLIILKCIVGAGDGLCCCRATEGSVEQHCAAVVTPCQVKFAASCAEPSAVLSTSEHTNSSGVSVHGSKGAALIQAWTDENI